MEKGYSASSSVDYVFEKTVKLLMSVNVEMVVADLSSHHNVADIGTRPLMNYSEEDVKTRLSSTVICLRWSLAQYIDKAVTYVPRNEFLVDGGLDNKKDGN